MPHVTDGTSIMNGSPVQTILIAVDETEHNRIAKVKKKFRETAVGFGYDVRDSMRAANGLQAYNSTGDLVGEFNPRRDTAWVKCLLDG